MKDCLKLIHFHIGSQINKIRVIKNALREATQFYVELSKLGYGVGVIDIGGGLGVDYDGSRSSSSESSMNYSIQEYANDAVSAIVDVCQKNDLPQPNIITESGRSLTAHHSILIFDVLRNPPSYRCGKTTRNEPGTLMSLPRALRHLGPPRQQRNLRELARRIADTRRSARPLQPRHARP